MAEKKAKRCNCDASCGENRYHDFGSSGCMYEVKIAPRRKAKPTIVHVNQLVIRSNAKHDRREPPLSIRRGQDVQRAHNIEISGPCRIVYSPDKPLKCGAKVWIETFSEVTAK